MILSQPAVVIPARVAALLAPFAGELVRRARARGESVAELEAVAYELDVVRRAVAAAQNGTAGTPVGTAGTSRCGSPASAGDVGLVTVRDAARLFGVGERAVRARLARGTLAGRRVRGRWLVEVA